MWSELFDRIGQGAVNAGFKDPNTGQWNTNRIGMVLGQMGADMSPKGSFGHAAGTAAANIGVSNIYGKAQEKVGKEKEEYIKRLISAITPADAVGPNKVSTDGKTFTMTGNVEGVPNPEDKNTTGPIKPPSTPLNYEGTSGPINPYSGGEGTNPYDAVIKALSGFQSSPARLTSADYAGLSPEMIDALAGRSMQGQEMGLRTLDFLNNMLGPKAGRVIEGPQNYMLIDETTGKFRDLGIPVYRAADNSAPKTLESSQGIMQWNPNTGKFEPTGMQPYHAPSDRVDPLDSPHIIEFYNTKTGLPDRKLTTYRNYDRDVATLKSQGNVIGNAPTPPKPGDITQQDEVAIANLATIRNKDADDEKRKEAIIKWNAVSPNSTYAYIWNEDQELPQRIILPKKSDGTSYTLGQVMKAAIKNGRTLNEELKAKGLLR